MLQRHLQKTIEQQSFETGRGGNVATVDLGLTQEELFMNPATGDLTIKDKTSIIYVNEIGDSRWLK